MTDLRDRWRIDFTGTCAALEPAVRTAPDGFRWVDEDRANADVVRLYRGLVEVGMSRGWL